MNDVFIFDNSGSNVVHDVELFYWLLLDGDHGVVISSSSTVKIKVWSGPMFGGPFGP